MTAYYVIPALNLDARFGAYESGHRLYPVPGLTVEADSIDAAFDLAYAIGNREGADVAGQGWPVTVRSLSVGDVVSVRELDTHQRRAVVRSVASHGWQDVDVTRTNITRDRLLAREEGAIA